MVHFSCAQKKKGGDDDDVLYVHKRCVPTDRTRYSKCARATSYPFKRVSMSRPLVVGIHGRSSKVLYTAQQKIFEGKGGNRFELMSSPSSSSLGLLLLGSLYAPREMRLAICDKETEREREKSEPGNCITRAPARIYIYIQLGAMQCRLR